MRIISVTEFSTMEGTGKTTEIPLDTRTGLFFIITTGTYRTPPFTLEQENVPVIMAHSDRAQANVKITIENSTLKIEQGYQQASHGYLITHANDDWADTSELTPVTIDAMEIDNITLNNNIIVDITPSIDDVHVRLKSVGFFPTGTGYSSQTLTTKDGKTYIRPIAWMSHVASNDPLRYDYIYYIADRNLTAFIKP